MRLAALLHRLSRGRLSSAELPEAIELGDVGLALDEMYRQSAADLRERAGVLYFDATWSLRYTVPTIGDTHHTEVKKWQPGAKQQYVGLMHTHPPHGGATGVAFSEQDFATIIEGPDLILLLQTGSSVMALVRTEKTTPQPIDVNLLSRQMQSVERDARSQGLTPKQALVLANLASCEIHGLALYTGYARGLLRREYRP